MRSDIRIIAESCGFRKCAGGLRMVEAGVVSSIMEDGDGMMVVRHVFIDDAKVREVSEGRLTIDEAKSFLKALSATSDSIAQQDGKRPTYKDVLKRMDTERWLRDPGIGNRYSLPQRGGAEHDRKVVGDKSMDEMDKRAAKLAGNTFWQRPAVPGDYIDRVGGKNG